MIKVRLVFIDSSIDVADSFKTFQVDSFEALLFQIIELKAILKPNQPSVGAEVIVHLDLGDTPQDKENIKKVQDQLKFSKENQMLFRIEIDNPGQLTYLDDLQKKFDIIYQKSLKTWHKQAFDTEQAESRKVIRIKDVFTATEKPYLAVITHATEEPSEVRTHSTSSRPIRQLHAENTGQIPNISSEPLLLSYAAIVTEFKDIHRDLDQCGGIYGMRRLFSFLKKFPGYPADLTYIRRFKELFLLNNHVNIQDLMSPSGQQLIDMCSSWPETFLKHFLNLAGSHHAQEPKNLGAFISKMHVLWKTIEPYNVLLPSEMLCYDDDFFARIDHMQALIDAVSPAWKEHQIKLIFDLNWNNRQEITRLFQAQTCQWIHPLMFDPNPCIRQFFIDAATFMKTNAIDTLESYRTYLQSSEVSAAKYKFLAWFLSFLPIPRLDELKEMITWFEGQSSQNQELRIRHFFSDTCFAAQFNFIDLKTIFELSRQKEIPFEALLDFQYQWLRKYPEFHKTHWQTIIDLLRHHDGALPSLNTKASFNTCYFQTMVALVFSESEASMSEILAAFNRYEPIKQDAIIAILRSLKFEHGRDNPPAQVFLSLLQTHLDTTANILQESQWQSTFPGLTFTYFANNINYQRIFDSLEQICKQLADSITDITSMSINFAGRTFGIMSLLTTELEKDLKGLTATLNAILQDLQAIKNSNHKTLPLNLHFSALKDIERQLDNFFKKKLGSAFKSTFPLQYLDKELIKDNATIKDLFIAISKNFSKIPGPIAKFFNQEMLGDMKQVGEEQSIVANMMETQLIVSFRQELKEQLESRLNCHATVRPHRLKCVDFLGKMQLNDRGVINFFNRLQNFTIILSDWPKIEEKCQQFQETPLSIWQLCIKHQHEPNVSCYWRACFDVLERLFKHHKTLDKSGAKKFIHLFELIIKQKSLFPDELGSNGEINHRTWQVFLNFLDRSLSTPGIYQNQHFLCLFALGIQFTLKNGQEFQFSKMMTMFSELGLQNNQFLPLLVESLEAADEEKQTLTQHLITKLGPIFKESKSRPWFALLAILLTPTSLQNHLQDILDILDCIQNHPEFDLLSIIVNDENRFAEDYMATLRNFIDRFQNMPEAWKTSYQKTFFTLDMRQTQETITEPSTNESKPSIWSQLLSSFQSSAPPKPQITTEVITQIAEPEAPNYWPIIIRPPYPDIRRLTNWLSEPNLQSLATRLQHFDRIPTANPMPIPNIPDAEFKRIIDELECYDGKLSKSQKQKLYARLLQVWTLGTSYTSKMRGDLIKDFHDLYPKLGTKHSQDDENKLIAILAAIYQKIDQKMPYPTQLLPLVMVFEYGPQHLVAEVDTSEGKATIIAMLAVLKWSRKENNTVIVLTHNQDLVVQDYEQKKHVFLFNLLKIPSGMIIGDTNEDVLQANGIYYTTKDNLRIFREKRRSKGQLFDFSIDYITDEVDELILDESTKINMVKINPLTQDMHWIYPQIHQFIQSQLSHSGQYTPKGWGLQLKQAIMKQNENDFQHILKLKAIPEEKWLNWIKAGLYVQSLVENIDFIVQELDSDDGRLFTTVPYVNGSPKHGYQLAYLALEGIPQLLHAKLTSAERGFIMEDETSIVSELPSINLRHCGNFTGFSGSIGGVRELLSLQEIVNAKAIRIGRYHPKKLCEHPAELLRNHSKLWERVLSYLESRDQPFLIVTRKINDAQALYDFLKKQPKIKQKQLKLITGQESETTRRHWLYNEGGNRHFAGETNCITISTQICGRGTDIRVRHPKGLFVILTDVLDPRNLCQNKGRAARAGHPGDFIALYNINQLNFEWGFLNLPTLSQETLACWIQQIQQFMICSNSKERISFMAQAWCHYHLSTYLDKALIGQTPLIIEKSHTKLRQLLAQTWERLPSSEYHFQNFKILTHTIWTNLRTYLHLIGVNHVQEIDTEKDFKFRLQILSAQEWQTIVKAPDAETFFLRDIEPNTPLSPQPEPIDNGIDKFNYSPQLIALRDELARIVPLLPTQIPWFQYISHVFFSILSWFNPSAKKLNQYLNQSWHDFNHTPSFENWSKFYTTLLTAESLQERQARNRFLRIDYWFKSWNPLGQWCQFKILAEKSFKRIFSESQEQQIQDQSPFQTAIQNIGFELSLKPELLNPFTEEHSGIIFKLMGYFYPQTYAILNETYQTWLRLNEEKENLELRNALVDKLTELHHFYEQHHAHRFFPFSYWEQHFQLWQSVSAHLSKAQEDSIPLAQELIDWAHEARMKSKQSLLYMGHLMCQQQIKTNDIRFYFNVFNSSRFLSDIQQEYEREQKNSDLELEIDELSRYFPQELISIFNQHHPLDPIHNTLLSQEECKKLCIKVLENVIVSGKPNEPTSLDVKDKQLQVLIHELEQWHNRRGLLPYLRA